MEQEPRGSGCTGGNRGVSPVVGVVLMVAVTVILAGVIGAFAFSYGDNTGGDPPELGTSVQYDRSTDANGQYLNVSMKSGDRVEVSTLTLFVEGAESVAPGGAREDVEYTGNVLTAQVGSELGAGESFSLDRRHFTEDDGDPVDGNKHLDISDATVRIVWQEGPESSQTVFTWSK